MTQHRDIKDNTDGQRARTASGRRGRHTRFAAGTTVVLAAALLAGCGGKDTDSSPKEMSGAAKPASGDTSHNASSPDDSSPKPSSSTGGNTSSSRPQENGSASPSTQHGGANKSPAGDSTPATSKTPSSKQAAGPSKRCHTSELKASVGKGHPGAGQRNFALVLTNSSGHACTVRGYPGVAFVNDAGQNVSVDPERTSGQQATVTLAPGHSAWAPLSYGSPEMTDVPTTNPTAVKVTPPDEKASLQADWSGGPVTKTGKASVPKVGPLSAGTGA